MLNIARPFYNWFFNASGVAHENKEPGRENATFAIRITERTIKHFKVKFFQKHADSFADSLFRQIELF
jgi:hypothetical protein